jgi:hypothetical protein
MCRLVGIYQMVNTKYARGMQKPAVNQIITFESETSDWTRELRACHFPTRIRYPAAERESVIWHLLVLWNARSLTLFFHQSDGLPTYLSVCLGFFALFSPLGQKEAINDASEGVNEMRTFAVAEQHSYLICQRHGCSELVFKIPTLYGSC